MPNNKEKKKQKECDPFECCTGGDCSSAPQYCWNCGVTFCKRHYRLHACIYCEICGEIMIERVNNYKARTFTCKCPNGHKITEKLPPPKWMVPIDGKFVILGKKALRLVPTETDDKIRIQYDRTEKVDDGYILRNAMITGVSKTSDPEKGGIYILLYKMAQMHDGYFPIKFSMPKACLLEYETDRYFEEQQIKIDEYGYECYFKQIDRLYEAHGRKVNFYLEHFDAITNNPIYREYKETEFYQIIKKLKQIYFEKEKKKLEENIMTEDKNKEIENVKADVIFDEKQQLPVLYCDGAGNLYNDEKRSEHGHYSVYYNEAHKFKNYEDAITSNEAEIKGVIGCFIVAEDLGIDAFEIKTDSQNVCKWLNGRGLKICSNITEIWRTNQENIKKLIDKLEELFNNKPEVILTWIPRDKNLAHSI